MFDQNRKSCVQPKKVYQLYFRSSCDCTVCIVNVALCIVNCECVCSIWESAKKCNTMCNVRQKFWSRRESEEEAEDLRWWQCHQFWAVRYVQYSGVEYVQYSTVEYVQHAAVEYVQYAAVEYVQMCKMLWCIIVRNVQ